MQCHPFDPPEITQPDDPSRPKGLHVSQIITDLLRSVDERYQRQSAMPWLKITSGMAYERALEDAIHHILPGGSFRPPAVLKDGIWCSPDHVAMDPWRGREFKLTWYSMRKPFPEHDVYWGWLVQMQAYAYVLETCLFECWVLYVNGDYPYGGPPSPVLKAYALEFTPQELHENWGMLVNHAKYKGWLE